MIVSALRVALFSGAAYVYGRSAVQEIKKPAAERDNANLVISTALAGLCATVVCSIISSK